MVNVWGGECLGGERLIISFCNVLASAQFLFLDVYFLQISILEGNMNTNVTLRLVWISLKRQNYPPIHIEEGCNLFRLNFFYL